ncbi:MAG: amidohydrolase, partial [Dehalococcoidales bacterium]|nr:amidohydrolase [Dehalococcoidales bacterium]
NSNTNGIQTNASLVILNGKVITVNKTFSIAEAVAVRNDKIVAVGLNQDIKMWAGRDTETIDLKGKTMLPGINDTHAHMTDWSSSRPPLALDVHFPNVNSIADIIKMVNLKYKETKKGEWIQGAGWDEGYLEECRADPKRLPKKEDLDTAAPDVPVAIYEYSHHRMWVNSKALELAGITKDTPDPVGSRIGRNPDTGEPDGLLYEKAPLLVSALIPPMTKEQVKNGLLSGMSELNSLGITSFTDGAVNRDLWAFYNDVFNDSFDNGKWTCRVNLLLTLTGSGSSNTPMIGSPEDIEEALNYIGCRHNFGSEWLRIAGAKIGADGISPLKTGWMYKEYEGGGLGGLVVKGHNVEEQEQNLREMISLLHKNRFQVGIHSCGERSIEVCYDQFIKCLKEDPWDARHYCIHCDFAMPETIKKVGEFCRQNVNKLGMNVQSSIRWTIANLMVNVVGPKRAAYVWPLRAMLDAGIRVTDSSDAPVTYPNFLHGIHAAVLRESKATGDVIGAEQSITVREAVMNYTINSAWQDHQESIKGSIEVGKLADFCVLDRDILNIEPHSIKDLRNVMTIVGGRVVYAAEKT